MMVKLLKSLKSSFLAVMVFTFLAGVVYPLIVTAVAQVAFPREARGSLISVGDRAVGSELLAQAAPERGYFVPRPSAAGYATIPSGASNLGLTSKSLQGQVAERRVSIVDGAGIDAVTTSASGLDPHISLATANAQVDRVAAERSLTNQDKERLLFIVSDSLEGRQLGFLGLERVNVLKLNLAIDREFKRTSQ